MLNIGYATLLTLFITIIFVKTIRFYNKSMNISLEKAVGTSLTKGIHGSQLIQDVLCGDFLHTEPEVT
jgi:hypothetical protein